MPAIVTLIGMCAKDTWLSFAILALKDNIIASTTLLIAFINMQNLGAQTKNSVQFCTELIEKHNIALVPGNAFGAEGFVRLSFGAEEAELEAALSALRKVTQVPL